MLKYSGKNSLSKLIELIKNKLDSKLDSTANAVSADKITEPVTISLKGDVTGSVSFDGSADVEISTTINEAPVEAQTLMGNNFGEQAVPTAIPAADVLEMIGAQEIIQYIEMPAEATEGAVVQYIGVTDENYINGTWYGATLDADGVTYVWEPISPGGVYVGDGEMPDGYNVQIDPEGTTFEPNVDYQVPICWEDSATGLIKTIDPKFIPAEATTQSDWDVNDPSAPEYINNRPFYSEYTTEEIVELGTFELTESSYTDVDGNIVYVATGTNDSFYIEVGLDYILETDVGDWGYCIAYDYNGAVALGNANLVDNSLENSYDTFFFTHDGSEWAFYSTDNTTRGYLGIRRDSENVVKIDPKYLPSAEENQGDWYESDPSSPRYINNRTHYEEISENSLYTFSGIELIEDCGLGVYETVYAVSSNDPSLSLDYESEYVVQFPGYWVGVNPYEYDGRLTLGNIGLIDSAYTYSGEPFLIAYDTETFDYTIYSSTEGVLEDFDILKHESVAYPLDEKFIPETIARKDGVVPIPENISEGQTVVFNGYSWNAASIATHRYQFVDIATEDFIEEQDIIIPVVFEDSSVNISPNDICIVSYEGLILVRDINYTFNFDENTITLLGFTRRTREILSIELYKLSME